MKKVKCSWCGQVYDLGDVSNIIARYADATVFEAPCCHRTVDDRSWKSMPDFTEYSGLTRRAADGFALGGMEELPDDIREKMLARGIIRRR